MSFTETKQEQRLSGGIHGSPFIRREAAEKRVEIARRRKTKKVKDRTQEETKMSTNRSRK